MQLLSARRPSVPPPRQAAPGQDVIQGVFLYSFMGDRIIENDRSKQYYTDIGFETVKANGLEAVTDPRNKQRAEFLLKVMSYQELYEQTPTAGVVNNPEMGGADAKGVFDIISTITTQYDPGSYDFIAPGASGDLIALGMQRMGIPVARIAISGIKDSNMNEINSDTTKYNRLKTYMYRSLGHILDSTRPVVIIDAVDKGASILLLKDMIEKIAADNSVSREVHMLSLTVTKEALKEKNIQEVSADTDEAQLIKSRIYWQQYKDRVPRLFDKLPIDDILSGTITDPPAPIQDNLLKQIGEMEAMVQAIYNGQYIVDSNERLLRALMNQLGMTRQEAIEAAQSNNANEESDSGRDSGNEDGSDVEWGYKLDGELEDEGFI